MKVEKPEFVKNLVRHRGKLAAVAAGAVALGGGATGVDFYIQHQQAVLTAEKTPWQCRPIRNSWGPTPEFRLRDPSITIQYMAQRLGVSVRRMQDGTWGAVTDCAPAIEISGEISVSDKGSPAIIPSEEKNVLDAPCLAVAHPWTSQNTGQHIIAFCPGPAEQIPFNGSASG
jgi:hypothetical protein